jgi:hypothetical protein
MIVTSLPRSGSTKYCVDLAKRLNLPFYDEIFELEINSNHKQSIHEITLDVVHPKTTAFIQSLDFEQCVINNHEINFFTLEKTDVFLSRRNVQDSVWSYLAYTDKYIKQYTGSSSDDQLHLLVGKYLKRITLFYEYCSVNNKEIIIPDLDFSDSSKFREMYPQFKYKIDKFKETINLPRGLEFA